MSKHIHLDDTSDLRVMHGMTNHNVVERQTCQTCIALEEEFHDLMRSGRLDAIMQALDLGEDIDSVQIP